MIFSNCIKNLERRFAEIKADNPREAAEVAFAIATHYRNTNPEKSKQFVVKCLDLLRLCGTENSEECACANVCICNITLPDFLHEGVVASHFPEFEIPIPVQS